jgi:DNA-binding transcriptional ArsR family regulator
MTTPNSRPHEALERMFHEPNRLAIMSALCAAEKGLPFVELRDACGLTDGNLNRHLKVLQESGIVRVDKAFVEDKPRTTVHLSGEGLRRFQTYLGALASALKQARDAMPAAVKAGNPELRIVPV